MIGDKQRWRLFLSFLVLILRWLLKIIIIDYSSSYHDDGDDDDDDTDDDDDDDDDHDHDDGDGDDDDDDDDDDDVDDDDNGDDDDGDGDDDDDHDHDHDHDDDDHGDDDDDDDEDDDDHDHDDDGADDDDDDGDDDDDHDYDHDHVHDHDDDDDDDEDDDDHDHDHDDDGDDDDDVDDDDVDDDDDNLSNVPLIRNHLERAWSVTGCMRKGFLSAEIYITGNRKSTGNIQRSSQPSLGPIEVLHILWLWTSEACGVSADGMRCDDALRMTEREFQSSTDMQFGLSSCSLVRSCKIVIGNTF